MMKEVVAMNLLTVCRQWLLITFCRSLALLAASLRQNAGCCFVVYLKGRKAVYALAIPSLRFSGIKILDCYGFVVCLSLKFRSKVGAEVV